MSLLVKLVLSVFVVCSLQHAGAEKLKVSVYYESLCPHSIAFITNQLAKGYSKIGGDYLDIDFVPYGKATHTLVDGKWKFSCQHGSWECYGNKLQVCALNQNKPQDDNVKFIDCAMGSSDPSSDDDIKACADEHGFSWDEIESCKDSSAGDELLVVNGDRTHAVVPKITYVPTIIFNDKYDSGLQNQGERKFFETACGLLEDKPDICVNHYSHMG